MFEIPRRKLLGMTMAIFGFFTTLSRITILVPMRFKGPIRPMIAILTIAPIISMASISPLPAVDFFSAASIKLKNYSDKPRPPHSFQEMPHRCAPRNDGGG
jgi:hypothetical protein